MEYLGVVAHGGNMSLFQHCVQELWWAFSLVTGMPPNQVAEEQDIWDGSNVNGVVHSLQPPSTAASGPAG